MLRDSRIVHIIDLLGELRELLLVIDQAGDTAPAILLKLAKEKAEEKSKELNIEDVNYRMLPNDKYNYLDLINDINYTTDNNKFLEKFIEKVDWYYRENEYYFKCR